MDNLLSEGKIKSDKKGLGFSRKNEYNGEFFKVFVRSSDFKSDDAINTKVLHTKSDYHKMGSRSIRKWICHLCGKAYHIRSFCYKLYVYN